MSLTSFLENPDVTERFREQFSRQPIHRNLHPIAPPLSDNAGLVGTAFDYLFRFYLQRLNRHAITSPWIAEKAVAFLGNNTQLVIDTYKIDRWTLPRGHEELKSLTSVIQYRKSLYEKASRILRNAKLSHSHYLKHGKIDRQLLKSVLLLAQLDPILRTRRSDLPFGAADKRDIDDLQALIELVNPKLFKSKKTLVLNPNFGIASLLVNGADADVVIDNMILEVKTTKKLQVQRDYWNQLIGYYLLATIGGIQGIRPDYKIQRIGIYFSRFGELLTFDITEVMRQNKLRPFLRWFIKRANKEKRRMSEEMNNEDCVKEGLVI